MKKHKKIGLSLLTTAVMLSGSLVGGLEVFADGLGYEWSGANIDPGSLKVQFRDENNENFKGLSISAPIDASKWEYKLLNPSDINKDFARVTSLYSNASYVLTENNGVYTFNNSNELPTQSSPITSDYGYGATDTNADSQVILYAATALKIQNPFKYIKSFDLDTSSSGPGTDLDVILGARYVDDTSEIGTKSTIVDNSYLNDTEGLDQIKRFVKDASGNFEINVPNFSLVNGSTFIPYIPLFMGTASHGVYGSGRQYSGLQQKYNGSLIYRANYHKVTETFEYVQDGSAGNPTAFNSSMASQLPPLSAGGQFTQNKTININSNSFTYNMADGDELATYTARQGSTTYQYEYKGWYQGTTYPGLDHLNTTDAPNISNSDLDFSDNSDTENQIHIVYDRRQVVPVTNQHVYFNSSSSSYETISGVADTSDSFIRGNNYQRAASDIPATVDDGSNGLWRYTGNWYVNYDSSNIYSGDVDFNMGNMSAAAIQYIYEPSAKYTMTEEIVDTTTGQSIAGSPTTTNPSIFDGDDYTATPAGTFDDTDGNTWNYVGWENITDDAGNIRTDAVEITNVSSAKAVRFHYERANTTAEIKLTPDEQIVKIPNGSNDKTVTWTTEITNTHTSNALANLKLTASTQGLTNPINLTITVDGQDTDFSNVNLASGVALTGVTIPAGKKATVVFTSKASGAANTIVPAEVTLKGNLGNDISADNFVRIDDNDEPNQEAVGGLSFINLPDFRFGSTKVNSMGQNKKLDASEYENPAYAPYVRFKNLDTVNPNWVISVKMSQFTGINASGVSDSLSTATSLTLGEGKLNRVEDFNTSSERLSQVGGNISKKTIQADGVSTGIELAQGTAQGIYQLDYDFDDVALFIPANQGMKGVNYTSTLDWTLTNAP